MADSASTLLLKAGVGYRAAADSVEPTASVVSTGPWACTPKASCAFGRRCADGFHAHGEGAWGRAVSEYVMRHARCPVLVVRALPAENPPESQGVDERSAAERLESVDHGHFRGGLADAYASLTALLAVCEASAVDISALTD